MIDNWNKLVLKFYAVHSFHTRAKSSTYTTYSKNLQENNGFAISEIGYFTTLNMWFPTNHTLKTLKEHTKIGIYG